MKCAPAVHDYKPLGKILFCRRCADVQPLLLSTEFDDPARVPDALDRSPTGTATAEPVPEPSPEELEHVVNQLREAAGLSSRMPPQRDVPEQLDLGVRHEASEDELLRMTNEFTQPRVPVNEGFQTSAYDEELPDAGL